MPDPMLLYVAGPYRGHSLAEVDHNIQTARRVAIAIWEQGHYAICPHLNTANFHDDCKVVDEGHYLRGYIKIVLRCDGVVMVPGWEGSEGAREERRVAIENHLPVFYFPDLPSPFAVQLNGGKPYAS